MHVKSEKKDRNRKSASHKGTETQRAIVNKTQRQGIAWGRPIQVQWILLFPSAPLVRQAKPGRSCGLGGVHHVNGLFDM